MEQVDRTELYVAWDEFLRQKLGAAGVDIFDLIAGPDPDLIARSPALQALISDPAFHQALSSFRSLADLASITDEQYLAAFEPMAPHYGFFFIIPDMTVTLRELVEWLKPDEEVLDVACGPCPYLAFLKSQGLLSGALYGLDASPGILHRAADVAQVAGVELELIQGWMHQLPLVERSFRQVVCIDGVHWTSRWKQAVRELARVTADGGRLFIIYSVHSPRRRIPYPDLVGELSQNGIDVDAVDHFAAEASSTPRVFLRGTKRAAQGLIAVGRIS